MTYGFANVLGQIIGFLLLPLYTSYLSPTDYGVMAMVTFISMFFTPLAHMGVTNAIFRRFNLLKDVDLQTTSLSSGSIFVLFSSLVWLMIGFIFSKELTLLLVEDLKFEYLVQISLITSFFISIGQIFTVVLRAERKVSQLAIVRVLELLLTVGCTIYFVVVLDLKVEGVVKGGLIGGIFSFFVQYILCFKFIKIRLAFDELKELLNYGLPFLPHRLLAYGSGFLSQFFIKEFIGLSETGLYNIALRFALPLTFIISSVQAAWVPIKFQTHREEENKSPQIFRQLISLYFIIITILYAGSVIVGPELLRLMTASDYHDAVYLLPFVLLVPFSKGIYFMFGTGFEFTDNTKPMPLISGTGLVGLFLISYFTFNTFGIYGIIVGLACSWLIMAFIMRHFAVKRFYVPINFRLLLKLSIVIVLLGVTTYLIQNFPLKTRITIEGILALISGGILVGFLIFSADLKSLDINKYPLFSKLNKVLLPILNLIKR